VDEPVNAADVRNAIGHWVNESTAPQKVAITERTNPPYDPNDDYRIIYEAVFDPTSLHSARLEILLTDDGSVGIGVETYERLAKRLRKKRLRDGFAAGHEPRQATQAGLAALIDIVSAGRLYFDTRTTLGILTSARMKVLEADGELLKRSGLQWSDWMSTVSGISARFKRLLSFQPWG
jgi:hypothetical protein